MTERLPCIWCLKHRAKSKEHIIPEVLGCPNQMVLKRGEVCGVCNHGPLATLDGVLAESFDFMAMHVGQRGKKGRRPRIKGRTNLRGGPGDHGEPEYHFNLEDHAVTSRKYGTISPRSGSYRDVEGSFEVIGDQARIRMTMTVGAHPDFSRAIHKIAFEFLTLVTSWELATRPQFDPVREFVMAGRGRRQVIVLLPSRWVYHHDFPLKFRTDPDGGHSVEFVLCGVLFWVYLGTDPTAVEQIKRMALTTFGQEGWTILPNEGTEQLSR